MQKVFTLLHPIMDMTYENILQVGSNYKKAKFLLICRQYVSLFPLIAKEFSVEKVHLDDLDVIEIRLGFSNHQQ